MAKKLKSRSVGSSSGRRGSSSSSPFSRRVGGLLAVLYVITTHLPGVMVLAAPQYFSRPGAGVNATPLDVLSFSGSEFGEVSDAVNLVNGNVYLDLGAISRNNTLKPGEDAAGSFGNFKTNGIQRLAGFSPTMTAVPTEWSLGVGDGSYQVFRRATAAEITAAPSWIKERYAAMQASVTFFISKPLAGTQVDEQWIVTYKRSDNRYVSHHYSHTGTRTTFLNDGEYADFTQTPHEQYRTAKAANTADGVDGVTGTFKTQFTYQGLNSGRVTRVEDGWGRVTTYQWNVDNTLESVSLLLQNTADTASWARRIEYSYKDFGGQKMVWYMGFRTFDGRGGFVGRWYSFNYKLVGSAWLLDWVKRPIMASGGAGDMGVNKNLTTYNYDSTGRVSSITETNKPITTFDYVSTPNPDAVGGTRVTRTTGNDMERQITHYDYTTEGWLRAISKRNLNSSSNRAESGLQAITLPQEEWLTDTYWYMDDGSGRLKSVTQHDSSLVAGRASYLQYTYDSHGNRKAETVYQTKVNWTDPPTKGYLRTRSKIYDQDNRLSTDTTPLTEGNGDAGSSYRYEEVKDTTTYTNHATVTAATQVFKAVSTSSLIRSIASVNGNPLKVVTTLNESGLVTSQIHSGTGVDGVATTYTYHANRASNVELKASTFLQATLPASGSAVVYGDMVSAIEEGGRREEYDYDRAGNLSRTFKRQSHSFRLANYDTEIWSTFNGWGQPVFQLVRDRKSATDIKDVQAKGWSYRPSGELTASWEGSPSNLTLYTIDAVKGRVVKIERGLGSGLALSAVRTRTVMEYDAFDRVNSIAVNENVTSVAYDTLNRVVWTARPDQGQTATIYDPAGGVATSRDLVSGPGIATTANTTSFYRDNLNRETTRILPNGASINTSYDAFDRPITITDNRLTMLDNASDRTTYLKYDNQGNLIKKLDPMLASSGATTAITGRSYTDLRRPYTEWMYDGWNRQTSQKVLLRGTVTPSGLTFPTGATAAETTTHYDTLSRPDLITDPEGFTTKLYHDNNGNITASVRQIWKDGDQNAVTLGNTLKDVTTYYAHDALNRQIWIGDRDRMESEVSYDIFGNVTAIKDGRYIVNKHLTYTPDGLLEKIYEPDNDPGTQTDSMTSLTGYVITEFNKYTSTATANSGDGTKPMTTWRAYMNTPAGSGSGAETTYTYDYAGRLLTTTLPYSGIGVGVGSEDTVVQRYNQQGLVSYQKDQNGFETNIFYNNMGLPLKVVQAGRVGNLADSTANLTDGLISNYGYDAAGNLLSKDEHGLLTEYRYNSLGKVILESRPRVGTSTTTKWKATAYRLDGPPSARTSYTYIGDLTSNLDGVSVGFSSPSVTAGNLTLYLYNKRGEFWAKRSISKDRTEYTSWQDVNGIGQRYRRAFFGDSSIYVEQKANNVTPLNHANVMTYWRFDEMGNLSEKWDTPMNNAGGPSSARPENENDKQNKFTYSYDGAHRETEQTRDIQVKTLSQQTDNPLYTTYGGNTGVVLAASVATVTTIYNERGQIIESRNSEQVPYIHYGNSPRQDNLIYRDRAQKYTYYLDGRIKTSQSGNVWIGYKEKRVDGYDQQGRETLVYDSDGSIKTPTAATIRTTYFHDGQIVKRVERNGQEVFVEDTSPTINGLPARQYITKAGVRTSILTAFASSGSALRGVAWTITETVGSSPVEVRQKTYNSYGLLASSQTSTGVVRYVANYDSDGDMYAESKPNRNGVMASVGYTLDSLGNRLMVTGGDAHGFAKFYNADGYVAQFIKRDVGYFADGQLVTGLCNRPQTSTCNAARYNDFRYDPFGQQVLSSTAQIDEVKLASPVSAYRYSIARDWNNVHTVEGDVQAVGKHAGNFLSQYLVNNATTTVPPDTDTYRQVDDQYRDATYTLADGYEDELSWDGTRLFAFVGGGVQPLDAPVTSLSSILKINPLDVVTQGLPNLPDPGQIVGSGVESKDVPVAVTTGADQGRKQTVSNVLAVPGQASAASTQPTDEEVGQILTQDVSANFDDGQGFGHPIYANTVREFGEVDENGVPVPRQSPTTPNAVVTLNENQQDSDLGEQTTSSPIDPIVAATSDEQGKSSFSVSNKTNYIYNYGVLNGTVSNESTEELQSDPIKFGINYGETQAREQAKDDWAEEIANSRELNDEQKEKILKDSGYDYEKPKLGAGTGGGAPATVTRTNSPPAAYGSSYGSPADRFLTKYVEPALMFIGNTALETAEALAMATPIGRGAVLGIRVGRRGVVGTLERAFGKPCSNSFAPSTPVRTLSGLVAISALSLGTPVLAFNEQTGENGYYPITAVITHGSKNQGVTYLTINDTEQGNKLEFIETTPEHPFYLSANVDTSPRPQPEGHADLSTKWVGAGHLKVGDQIKQADGTVGVIANVITIQQTQEMFNLTVSEAHTYYVGQDGWLVHNAGGGNPPIDPKTGLPLVRDPVSGLLRPQPPLAPRFSGQPDLTPHAEFRLDVTNRQLPASQQWDILTNGTPHYDTAKGNFVYTKGNKAVIVSSDGKRVVTVLDNISNSNQALRGVRERWLPTGFNVCP